MRNRSAPVFRLLQSVAERPRTTSWGCLYCFVVSLSIWRSPFFLVWFWGFQALLSDMFLSRPSTEEVVGGRLSVLLQFSVHTWYLSKGSIRQFCSLSNIQSSGLCPTQTSFLQVLLVCTLLMKELGSSGVSAALISDHRYRKGSPLLEWSLSRSPSDREEGAMCQAERFCLNA